MKEEKKNSHDMLDDEFSSHEKKKQGNDNYRRSSFLKNLLFFLVDVFLNAVIIVGLVFIIRVYLISPFRVYGPSMCNTLNYIGSQCLRENGEYIIVNKVIYRQFYDFSFGKPERFDIVVFRPPQIMDDFYIKRIIGLPGETVKLIDGYVYILNDEHPEGFKLDEPYLNSSNQGNTLPHRRGYTVFEVPEDSFFVLGDNRRFSSDSRHCFSDFGCTSVDKAFVSFKTIAGKAWISLWPFRMMRFL